MTRMDATTARIRLPEERVDMAAAFRWTARLG